MSGPEEPDGITENQMQEWANEAERGYELGNPAGYQIINNGWQEHAGVYEVLVRKGGEDIWTRLEGFELKPLLKRAREIAKGSGGR